MTNSTTPYSLFTIPAMLLVSYYPVFLKDIVTIKAGVFDNVAPRSVVAKVSKSDPALAARVARMESAHFNGMENVPFFGLAVLAGHFSGVNPRSMNIASFSYVFLRIAYNYVYITQTTPRMSNIRSLIWMFSMGFPTYMMVKAGLAAM